MKGFIISGMGSVVEAVAFGNGDVGHHAWCPTGLVRVFSHQGSWLLWVSLFSLWHWRTGFGAWSSEKVRDKQGFSLTKILPYVSCTAPCDLPLYAVAQWPLQPLGSFPYWPHSPPACWEALCNFFIALSFGSFCEVGMSVPTQQWELNEIKTCSPWRGGVHKKCWVFLLSGFC